MGQSLLNILLTLFGSLLWQLTQTGRRDECCLPIAESLAGQIKSFLANRDSSHRTMPTL